jgi:hypothetical protein
VLLERRPQHWRGGYRRRWVREHNDVDTRKLKLATARRFPYVSLEAVASHRLPRNLARYC